MKLLLAAFLLAATVAQAADEPKIVNPFKDVPQICLPVELVKQVAQQNASQLEEIAKLQARIRELEALLTRR